MKRQLLSQETYDLLIDRLEKNHKAHKSDSAFHLIKRQIEKTAETTLNGVWVDRPPLEIAGEALAKNIKLAGAKYQTGYDRILLLQLEEALDAPQPAPSSQSLQPPPTDRAAPDRPSNGRCVDVEGDDPPFLDLSELPDTDI